MAIENHYFNNFMEMFALSCLISKPTVSSQKSQPALSANFEIGLLDNH